VIGLGYVNDSMKSNESQHIVPNFIRISVNHRT
jgi:hypothetical protein